MTTFTLEQRVKLEDYLANHILPSGLGTEESACSIAAINLAISGELTDEIPYCMSKVLGKATIRLQDAMPDEMRNSDRYKALLPNMAGTGRDSEPERLGGLMDWMWSTVVPQLQPLADEKGFGAEWSNMCRLKTDQAAYAAHDAAGAYAAARATHAAHDAAGAYAAARATHAAHAAAATAYAADAAYADAAAYAAADAADAAYADAAAYAADAAANAAAYAAYAAYAAAHAADAAGRAAYAAAADTFWNAVDPIGMLERMTYLKGDKQ